MSQEEKDIEAFYDYTYNEADIGLIKFISAREDMFTYIHGIVQAAYRSGVLYTTSDRQEGYLMLSGEGAGGAIGFSDGMRMIADNDICPVVPNGLQVIILR